MKALSPFVLLAASALAPASSRADPASRLMALSLEELATVQVTLVTGRPAALQRAAASVYVITGEDIRRSTATRLPEALRLAPNLEVARLNATQYAISARGFNNAIGNKLLVMVDGRTVYSPLFSGVFWDEQLVPMADIDRIEVVSGPGATLWGANAVNGVINVVTRSSRQTQGAALQATAGTDLAQGFVRYGGRLGERLHYRVHAEGQHDDATARQDGVSRNDGTQRRQAGFRADWDGGDAEASLQGDVYGGGSQARTNLAPRLAGGNLLGRWLQRGADGANWQLQVYLDRSSRDDRVLFHESTRTLDVQFTAVPATGAGHRVIWGMGHRRASSQTQANTLVRFDPDTRELSWSNVFVQDELQLGEPLRVTLGLKAERNVYTGWEWLPTLRAAWDLSPSHMLWAGLSRAVRAPARVDRDFLLPAKPPHAIKGGPGFESEVGTVAELGYRGQPGGWGNLSVTLFSGEYRRLRGGTPGSSFIENRISGRVSGAEAWGTAALTPNWRVSAGWTSLHKRFEAAPGTAPNSPADLGNDPRSQWLLRSNADLPMGIELDVQLRRVGSLPQPAVEAYTETDLRLAKRLTPAWTLSALLRNALDRGHVEFNAVATASEIRRAAYLQLEYRAP